MLPIMTRNWLVDARYSGGETESVSTVTGAWSIWAMRPLESQDTMNSTLRFTRLRDRSDSPISGPELSLIIKEK
jgi:hypothetical protein